MKKYILILVIFLASAIAGNDRSPEWSKVRNEFIKTHPVCAICGIAKDLNVHHIKPFHLYPELELDMNNLITLCQSKNWGFNCHLDVGHGGNYGYENPWLNEDIEKLKEIGCCTEQTENYLKFIRDRVKQFNNKSPETDRQ